VSVHDEVRTAVLRRLRRLTRADRAILMRAAVVGRHFDIDVVAATAAHPPARVRAALERAARLQLVVVSDRERYAFRHALTRDIVYAEALDVRLRPLHRRVARVLEGRARCDDAVLEQLAYHAWASGDVTRTLRYNELAGDKAAALHASEDASRYYRRARSLLDVETSSYARLTRKLDAAERLRR
jgi:predicted ATPase